MNSAKRRVLFLTLCGGGGVLLVGLAWSVVRPIVVKDAPAAKSPSQLTASRPAPPPDGFVGDSACAECHASVAKQYATHPMSRSVTRVEGDSTLDTFDGEVTIRPGGRCIYQVRHVGNSELAHEELMFDQRGELIYGQSVPVHYSIGSGKRGRTYVSNHNGLLLMSPISWFANGNRWDLSPGYVPDDERRFTRRITDECLACHAGRVAPQPEMSGHYATEPFAQLSIGCENCHGPGRQHVQARQNKSAVDRDPIVNPTKLPPAERESVCNQCHLQAAARIPRYGRSFLDFRPGQRLEEVLTVFLSADGTTDDGTTKSVSQVQQMMVSQCYGQSNGKLGCTSCHDPHRSPTVEDQADFYRERCLKCHQDVDCGVPLSERLNQVARNSCFACHMPRLRATDIAHTSQTDHRVLARPANAGTTASPDRPAGLIFFDGADKRLPAWEANRASGLAIIHYMVKHGRIPAFPLVEQLLAPGLQIAPDDTRVMVSLADVALKSGDLVAAEKYALQLLTQDPRSESGLAAMVLICYQNGRNGEGLAFADRLVQINPRNDTLHAQRSDMLRLAGQLQDGIEAGEQGLRLNPRLLPLRHWLSNAYRDSGQPAKSAEQLSIIHRIETAPRAK